MPFSLPFEGDAKMFSAWLTLLNDIERHEFGNVLSINIIKLNGTIIKKYKYCQIQFREFKK